VRDRRRKTAAGKERAGAGSCDPCREAARVLRLPRGDLPQTEVRSAADQRRRPKLCRFGPVSANGVSNMSRAMDRIRDLLTYPPGNGSKLRPTRLYWYDITFEVLHLRPIRPSGIFAPPCVSVKPDGAILDWVFEIDNRVQGCPAMPTIVLALMLLLGGLLPVESAPWQLQVRTAEPLMVQSRQRLSKRPRVVRIRPQRRTARSPRALNENEAERLRRSEELIKRQNFPPSICRGC
jgi:hypothetical protein